ncbi:MAG TPA: GGDEF domain-containing protein [Candidatus Dormibacteraeota bacterium]|nr:GGDEF domain-containing protein [Candidatus Dormibacteraeota bacterium]
MVSVRAAASSFRWRLFAIGAVGYVALCLRVADASAHRLPNAPARGEIEMGLLGLCLLIFLSLARWQPTRPVAYWRLLQAALVAMGWTYGFGAYADLVGSRAAGMLSGIGLLAAFPLLVAAVAVYTAAHCRFDRGLTALLDIAILVTSLLAIFAPPVLGPLLHHGGLRALAVGIGWSCDLAIVAGGGWAVLGWLRPREHPQFVGLIALLGGAFLVVSVQLALAVRGAMIPPWWLTALMGPGYLLAIAGPEVLRTTSPHPRTVPPAWTATRTWLPFIPASGLILAALAAVAVGATGGVARALTGGALVVSALVVARQLLLVRDHRQLLAQRSDEALLDPLTGLRNRRAFDEDLQAPVRHGPAALGTFRLILLDLDRLKEINDGSGGHGAGDVALIDTARALTAAARQDDRVYRIGGDEFALLLAGGGGPGLGRVVVAAAAELRARSEPLTFSAGSATWPRDGWTSAELFEVADRALYRAKRATRPEPVRSPGAA